MTAEQLTLRESVALEHLQKAEELNVTVAEYARTFDVDAKELYSAKQSLVRKGLIGARPGEAEASSDEVASPADFVAVQVALPPPAGSGPVCSIRHPSGLLIECTAFPPAEWLTALLSGARRVPARS
jgi:hypothetical protein